MKAWFLTGAGMAACLIGMTLDAQAEGAKLDVPILYLRQEVIPPPVLSNLDPIPEDLGLAGAEVALKDIQTTGAFLGHDFRMQLVSVAPGGDWLDAAKAALPGAGMVLVEGSAEEVLAVADLPEAKGHLLFNVASGAARLRAQECRANLLHTLPEDAARSDALMQVLQAKRWTRLVMVIGPKPADKAFAESMRSSASKFGLSILAEKDWSFDTDLRRAATVELPPFLQDFPDHDVVLVADEADDFGRYVPDNTWLPRPVAGSAGLVPTAWTAVLEQWGAVQLQDRFEAHAAREMQGRDYAAWLAVRAVGEAVTRTGSAEPAQLRRYMLSEAFALDGFKGRALSFRTWNGQMRQPIAVANAHALVTLAPVDGFLHQRTETDSLGLDQPESTCTAFGE